MNGYINMTIDDDILLSIPITWSQMHDPFMNVIEEVPATSTPRSY